MKNTYVLAMLYGGYDWHDSVELHSYLTENGNYEITNVTLAIANHIHATLTEMKCTDAEDDNKTITLVNIPTVDEIYENIQKKRAFKVTGDDSTAINAAWNPEKNKLNYGYWDDTVSYSVYYVVDEIESENVAYDVIENFLAYRKGVPSIMRCYYDLFTDLTAAKNALDAMKLHDKFQSCKELLVVDKTHVGNKAYQLECAILNTLKKHPELNNEETFRVMPEQHAIELNTHLGDDEKIAV